MKDEALRNSILITAQAYSTRRDHDGDLICNVLLSIVRGAETLDEAIAVEAPKRRRSKMPSQDRQAP
jgi:hypothetical protein